MPNPEANDPSLWAIVPTTFTDHNGEKWMFRRITVRDMVNLEQEGLTPEKIAVMPLLPLIDLSHRFLASAEFKEVPKLEDYQEMLSDDVLDRAVEAFRGCLTNFFPRAQRISARIVMREQEKYLQEMAELQAQMVLSNLRKLGSNTESSDSPSTVPESSASTPSTGVSENSPSPATASPESSEPATQQSETQSPP